MGTELISHEKKETQNKSFGPFAYIEISNDIIDKIDGITSILDEKNFFNIDGIKENLKLRNFNTFLNTLLKENNKNPDSISGIESKGNKFYIHFNDGGNINIHYKEFEHSLVEEVLQGEKKENIEKKVYGINKAIESIYSGNEGIIFDGEINNRDIVSDDLIKEYKLDKSLKDKNLKELKQILQLENSKLFEAYEITGESKKTQNLLKKEITFFAGIGDKYEGATSYIRLTTQEAKEKVLKIGPTMNIDELFNYIKELNEEIDNNYKRAAIVNQVNLKIVSALYNYSFGRLKKENANNRQFVALIKLITGRGKLQLDKNENYSTKQEFSYESIDVADEFQDRLLANNILIHLMYKKGGLIEKIEKQKKIKIEDGKMAKTTPSGVIMNAKSLFSKANQNGEEILRKLGYHEILNTQKTYNELTFQEKLQIGSLVRLIEKLQSSSFKSMKDIQKVASDVANETLQELNESLSDNFDAFSDGWLDFNGSEASDFGFTGMRAEIFELYQDINGNGLFDLSDENALGIGTVIFALSVVAALIILGPVFAAGAGAYSLTGAGGMALLKTGIATTIISQSLSHDGYASYSEMMLNVGSKASIDIISTITFGGLGFGALRGNILRILNKKGLKHLRNGVLNWKNLTTVQQKHVLRGLTKAKLWNPDLLFSKKAFSTLAGVSDKSFIALEVGTVMYASSKIQPWIKRKFEKDYTDTDENNNSE